MTDTQNDITRDLMWAETPELFCPECRGQKPADDAYCAACTRELAIVEASEAITEWAQPTGAEIRAKAKRYAELKRAPRLVVLVETGERFKPDELDRELDGLNAEIKAYCERTGETIEIDGYPSLRVTPSSTTWHRIEALIDGEPDLWAECMAIPGLVKLDASLVKAAQKLGKLQRLSQYAVQGEGSSRLEFDRRAR